MVLLVSPQVRGVKGVFLANQKVDGKVTTLITYNKGRDWDYLRPPSTDMNGKPTNCQPVGTLPCHTPVTHSLQVSGTDATARVPWRLTSHQFLLGMGLHPEGNMDIILFLEITV